MMTPRMCIVQYKSLITPLVFVIYKESYNNIACDDDDDEEVDNVDDMEYTKDAIDNMILYFSRD